jgi:hypothetical protein
MRKAVLALLALIATWILAYALAFLARHEPLVGGFRYSTIPVLDRIAWTAFWPLHALHRQFDGPRHADDPL